MALNISPDKQIHIHGFVSTAKKSISIDLLAFINFLAFVSQANRGYIITSSDILHWIFLFFCFLTYFEPLNTKCKNWRTNNVISNFKRQNISLSRHALSSPSYKYFFTLYLYLILYYHLLWFGKTNDMKSCLRTDVHKVVRVACFVNWVILTCFTSHASTELIPSPNGFGLGIIPHFKRT